MIIKIRINKFYIYCCFYFVRNVSNVNNILLDEGMKLIIEQLDISNLFLQIFKKTKIEQQLKEKEIKLEMSMKGKINLSKHIKDYNKYFNFT